jgi:DNA-binding HxlR family transcriptional regulator
MLNIDRDLSEKTADSGTPETAGQARAGKPNSEPQPPSNPMSDAVSSWCFAYGAGQAKIRSLVIRRSFQDPEIEAVFFRAHFCASMAHNVFTRICNSKPPLQETEWEIIDRHIRALFAIVRLYMEELALEHGKGLLREFALCGSCTFVGKLRSSSVHEAALAVGQWVLSRIWLAADRAGFCDALASGQMDNISPEKLDLTEIEKKYSAIVEHFQTLPLWDEIELAALLETEAMVTKEKRRACAAGSPSSKSFEAAKANHRRSQSEIAVNDLTFPDVSSLPTIDGLENLLITSVCACAPTDLVQAVEFPFNPLMGGYLSGETLVGEAATRLLADVIELNARYKDLHEPASAVQTINATTPLDEPTSAVQPVGDTMPVTVSKPGKLILGALLKNFPTLQSIEEICGTLQDKLSDKTVGRELKELIRAGLVVRPKKLRGATLTPEGKVLAEKYSALE